MNYIRFFFLMIRRPPRSTLDRSSAASDVYKRQNMFSMDDPQLVKIRELLQNLDINSLSPIEALMKLKELQDTIN